MSQRDVEAPKKCLDLCTSFDEFMKRKPKKMRNTYWRAYKAAWIAALEIPS